MGRQEKIKQQKKEEERLRQEKRSKFKKRIIYYSLMIIIAISAAYGTNYAYQKIKHKETKKMTSYKTGERQYSKAPDMQIDQNKEYFANMETNYGKIKIKLYAKEAPKTANNFIVLVRDKFYDGLIFHRIVNGFMIQGGDPQGSGTGGPGYKFDDELPKDKTYKRGIVAMANSGPNTNGSQFFIMHKDNESLPKNYSIFGEVTEGIETVDKIAIVEVSENSGGEASTPKTKVEIKSVTIEEK